MPDFKVIDGGGRGGGDLVIAEQEFCDALTAAVANSLRILRGAGKPYQLIVEYSNVVKAALKIHDLTGRMPSELISKTISIEDGAAIWYQKLREGTVDQESIDRWTEDGTFDQGRAERVIYGGVLRILAAQLLDQGLQKSHGENEFHDGLRAYEAAREKYRKKMEERYPPPPKRSRKRLIKL